MGRLRKALLLGLLLLAARPVQAGWYAFSFSSVEPYGTAYASSPLDRIAGEIRTNWKHAVLSIEGRSREQGAIAGMAGPATFPGWLPADGTPLRFHYGDDRVTSIALEVGSGRAYQFTCAGSGACDATYGTFGTISLPPLPAVPEPGTAGLFALALATLALRLRRSARARRACSGPPHPAGRGRGAQLPRCG